MTSVQTVLVNRHTDRIKRALDRLHSQRFITRLWDKDATLWTSDPTVQASILNRLGWLSISSVMSRQTQMLRRFTQEIRDAGFTRTLLLGMGGSGLFSEVCRNTFGVAPHYVDLTV
jgi:glucose-6-phosphate isomerase/transaldolase/glucose-6-phosphate isomerase